MVSTHPRTAPDVIMVAAPVDTEGYVLNDKGWSTDIIQ